MVTGDLPLANLVEVSEGLEMNPRLQLHAKRLQEAGGELGRTNLEHWELVAAQLLVHGPLGRHSSADVRASHRTKVAQDSRHGRDGLDRGRARRRGWRRLLGVLGLRVACGGIERVRGWRKSQ